MGDREPTTGCRSRASAATRPAGARRRIPPARPEPLAHGSSRWLRGVRRRLCSHAADLDMPRPSRPGPAARRAVHRRSAPRRPRVRPISSIRGRAGCRCPAPARRSCAAHRPAGDPRPAATAISSREVAALGGHKEPGAAFEGPHRSDDGAVAGDRASTAHAQARWPYLQKLQGATR